ncbi:hypothetical protein [Marinoscillum sp. MHG1-6]|uniref:hypothetical protein n=1 Tax=Marinoscillum sp. MHG1-6 TaxID=2959627 RepID=UPI0021578CD5|nr:hypothetical protein [Marinoscillum sp. MHG1-6]
MSKFWPIVALTCILFYSCSDNDEPIIENEEEIITDVILTFKSDSQTVTASAIDPDGVGFGNLEVVDTIRLISNTDYSLTIELENSVNQEIITEEIKAEADEHLLFFGFTTDFFTSPGGDGNIDDRSHPINYLDADDGGLPLGLNTEWTTGAANSGIFRVVLKHQPGLKSAVSNIQDGESEVDIQWVIEIAD